MTDSVAKRAVPAPLDPIVSLAVAVAESPGAYAFLLGAGVSKDAGVPTGGGVLSIALNDLYRLEHPEDDPPDEATLATWAADTGYANITYSEMLERLCPDPEGRRSYLAKHFEGREPGETHRLLACLAADGLVRVFVTTNFDRLLEQALREVGITPVVITAGDELGRASGREHARCYVLKVHGDYLQQTIRNTAIELATLDKKIEDELREVFERFGVVALGYSGSDEAVSRCLRPRNSRYGAYWVSRSEPAEAAAALVEALHARVIRRDTATGFLTDLTRRIEAFRAHPSGNTPNVVAAEIVGLLRAGDTVGLREKLKAEWRDFASRLRDTVEARVQSTNAADDVFVEVEAELHPARERILAALLPLIEHRSELFGEQLGRFAGLVEKASEPTPTAWPELNQWSAWWLTQVCGAFALRTSNYEAAGGLMRTRPPKGQSSLASLPTTSIGMTTAKAVLKQYGGENWSCPEWQHLIRTLSDSEFVQDRYPELVDGKDGPTRWLNDFNFLSSYAAVRAGERFVVGYWGMDSEGARQLAARLAKDGEFRDELARTVFGISGDELLATARPSLAAALQEPQKTLYIPGSWGLNSDALDELPAPPAAETSA